MMTKSRRGREAPPKFRDTLRAQSPEESHPGVTEHAP